MEVQENGFNIKMIRKAKFNEIQEKWDSYKTEFKNAGASSHSWAKGSEIFFYNHFELVMSRVYLELHQGTMQLWISESEQWPDEVKYLCLSHIQCSQFTRQKTLLLFAVTRTADIDEETMNRMWAEAFKGTASFAVENQCSGMVAYTDLDYLVDKSKSKGPWSDVVQRNFIYFPLKAT